MKQFNQLGYLHTDTIPYTFSEWLTENYHDNVPDIAPELLFDGYVYSLEQLGYAVFGNCYDGITVKETNL